MLESNPVDLPSKQTSEISFSVALNTFMKDQDWRAIHALFDMPDFNPSYRWISKNLNIPIETVSNAIEGLIALGLVKRTADGFQVLNKDLDLSSLGKLSKDDVLDACKLLTIQIVNERDLERTGLHRTTYLASNQDIVLEFKAELEELITKFRKKSLESKSKDGIYAVAAVATNLFKEKQ